MNPCSLRVFLLTFLNEHLNSVGGWGHYTNFIRGWY